jgi:hypothetical protein
VKVLAVVGGVVLALLGALMIAVMVDIAGTSPCEEVAVGECFDGSASKKTVVLVLGFAGAAAAIATLGLAIYYAARDRGGSLAALAALATIVLIALTLVI